MSLLSTPQNPILPLSSPSLFPRAIILTKPSPLPFLPLRLRLRHPTPLCPLLPPPRVTFDIPIKIDDDEYQRYLDTEPWKGAVVYRRDATVSHLEYSTSLNRLALGWLASRVSAERAAQMGLQLPDDLNWGSDDDDDEDEEDEDVGEGEGEGSDGGGFSGELNGEDVALEGKDKDGNPVYLTADELRNATISVKYDSGEFNFDDFDDDEEEEDDDDDDEEEGEEFMDTPVFVSVDVTRRRGRIRLDGIIRTVITLDCNRCFASAAQPVYSNFAFLLSEHQIGEPASDDEGTLEEMFDEGKTHKNMVGTDGGDEDRDIDWDDRLHFPAGEREIDISKQLRDIVHLEVNMNVVCSANCKGVCLQCGSNLNIVKCSCVKAKAKGREGKGASGKFGPLRDLRKKMGNNLG